MLKMVQVELTWEMNNLKTGTDRHLAVVGTFIFKGHVTPQWSRDRP